MKFKLILTYFILISLSSSAQKVWSLQDCFNHATKNNISVKQIELNNEFAKNDLKQSKLNIFLPNINASISEAFNFGNSIDPTTYQFTNNNTNSTRFSVSLNYNLFEGLSRINIFKSNKEKLRATELETEELKNNTRIAITNMYLQIVIAKEVLTLSTENNKLTQNQYNNTSALVNAGVLAKGALLDIDAQLAQNELNIINAEANLERSLNQLKLLLNLAPYSEFSVQSVEFTEEVAELNYQPESIAKKAMANLPEIQAIQYRMNAAEYDLKATKGSLWPTLSLSAFVGTNYFSASQEVSGSNIAYSDVPVFIDGNASILGFPSQTPIFENTKFVNQLQNNLSENVSLNLNIPILAAWQRRTAISNAKLNIIRTQLEIENKQQQLNQDVFNAYTDLKIAYKKYQATEKNITASNTAYNYADKKYKAGLLNALEFETARNRKISAQAEQLQAKYEYFFRKIILKYYNTGKLSF